MGGASGKFLTLQQPYNGLFCCPECLAGCYRMSESSAGFLSGIHALLVEQGIGKARKRILVRQVEERGGTTTDKISQDGITHIIVGSTVKQSRLAHLLKVDSLPKVPVVRADWLSSCLVAGKKLDTSPYLVPAELPSPVRTAGVQASLSPQKSPKVRHPSLVFSLVRAQLVCYLSVESQLLLKMHCQPQMRKALLPVRSPRPQRCGLG